MRLLATCLVLAAFSSSASFINYSTREINVKVVYVAVDNTSGSANLQYVYEKTNPEAKGKLISLAGEDGSTVAFFDFLPLSLGEIRGFKTRFHLYAGSGLQRSAATRRLMLKGVDGLVFVADGDPKRASANLRAFRQLKGDLSSHGYDWKKMPLTVQVQGDGVAKPVSPEGMATQLGLSGQPVFAATPATGAGVFDTLKSSAKQILMELKNASAAAPDAGR